MIDKVKYYAPAFTNKASFTVTSTGISMLLTEIEKLIEECNEELESAGLSGCCYSSQQEEIVKLQEDMDRLGRYVMSAGEYISAKLDEPLWRDFQNHATHTLSEIVLEDLHTENVIGVQEYYDVDSYSGREKVAVIKSQLTFEDFLTIKDLEEGEGLPLLDGMENIREFAEMFCPEYNQFCEQGCSMGNAWRYCWNRENMTTMRTIRSRILSHRYWM